MICFETFYLNIAGTGSINSIEGTPGESNNKTHQVQATGPTHPAQRQESKKIKYFLNLLSYHWGYSLSYEHDERK